ncbi:hypothetical protein AVEN_92220-1 [Araneus ventricosus]|uniref:Transposase Tc1-like domain-containing protein n=1 Tax=Araneus ventricosus TaxID=182803 RepID=A0A4Y2AMS5_ARAVE|nr:hypothetical protein AVEN_92220-1 [Araneus ventricosus]
MTKTSVLIYELVVLPDCHLPFLQLTGTPVKNEHLIKKKIGRKKTRILKRDSRATLPHIAADFNDGASTSVSVRTVQWTVINMCSQSRRSTRVPLLTALHKALLLSWARQHYHWTLDDWKYVTIYDESRFQLYRTDARVRVWRYH